jgi:hypothetical protein
MHRNIYPCFLRERKPAKNSKGRMPRCAGALTAMAIPYILILLFPEILSIIVPIQMVICLALPGCPATAVSWCYRISHSHDSSHSGTFHFSRFNTCTSSSVYPATLICFKQPPSCIASNMIPCCGSTSYAWSKCSTNKGRCCLGKWFSNIHNCSGKLRGFQTTCSIYFILHPHPLGGF